MTRLMQIHPPYEVNDNTFKTKHNRRQRYRVRHFLKEFISTFRRRSTKTNLDKLYKESRPVVIISQPLPHLEPRISTIFGDDYKLTVKSDGIASIRYVDPFTQCLLETDFGKDVSELLKQYVVP